jgi:hypothetical protein
MTKTTRAAVSGDTNAAILNERLRVGAILESPEGRRNPGMATELALRTALDAETAKGILAQAPAANPYLAAMDAQGPIGLLNATTADFTPADPKAERLKEIEGSIAAFNASRGFKTPKAGA